MFSGLIIVIAVLVLILASTIRIASENERFAVFNIGRYMGLKGPGLILKPPVAGSIWTRLAIGDQGRLIAPGMGSFKNIQIPVKIDSNIEIESMIRIVGFTSGVVEALLNPNQNRTITCDKCGHKMNI